MMKILLIGLIIFLILFGCTTTGQFVESDTNVVGLLENEQVKSLGLERSLSEANIKIVELQENNEYLRKQKENAETKFSNIEVVYSNLFTDAVSCYYANLCSYDDWSCVESLKDLYPGYTADDLYVLNSDWCDGMYRDWDEYQSFDMELN